MKILNEYPTHHYWTEYNLGELYCPECGKQTVWEESGEGDYYVGPNFICVSCSCIFTMQGPTAIIGSNNEIIVDQLKNGMTFQPSTPMGN